MRLFAFALRRFTLTLARALGFFAFAVGFFDLAMGFFALAVGFFGLRLGFFGFRVGFFCLTLGWGFFAFGLAGTFRAVRARSFALTCAAARARAFTEPLASAGRRALTGTAAGAAEDRRLRPCGDASRREAVDRAPCGRVPHPDDVLSSWRRHWAKERWRWRCRRMDGSHFKPCLSDRVRIQRSLLGDRQSQRRRRDRRAANEG